MRVSRMQLSAIAFRAWLDLSWRAIVATRRHLLLIITFALIERALVYFSGNSVDGVFWLMFWFFMYLFIVLVIILPFGMTSLLLRDVRARLAYLACETPAQALLLNQVLWKRLWPYHMIGNYEKRE